MVVRIKLTKGYEAVVDDCDADLAAKSWWATRNGRRLVYAQRKIDGRNVYLHRQIAARMTDAEGVVDHINGDGLDNRRANLRVVSHAANIGNRTRANSNSRAGVPGVGPYQGKWRAYAMKRDPSRKSGQRYIHIGYFATLEEAVAARQAHT